MNPIIEKGTFRQIGSVILSHLFIVLVVSAFGFGAFWWFLTKALWKELFSVICTAIYFFVLFFKGQKIAAHDKKSYSDETPFAWKGLILALGPMIITFILWLLYRMTWVFMTIDGSISGYSGIFYNIVFTIWTFPFNGIICLYEGGMFWYGHLILYLVPLISIAVGYYAGYKDINLYEKFLPMLYEKKPKE